MTILFIGNSYTYYHDMPEILQNICNEEHIDAEISSITAGGYSLSHYASENNEKGIELRKLIAENHYDFIVLQEQSVIPAENEKKFMNNVKKIRDVLKSTDAQLVFYETWARRDGEETLVKKGWSHEDMQKKLHDAYTKAAESVKADVVYAGDAVSKAYRNGIGDAMYEEDGSHPSRLASELVARCFFDYFFKD